MEDILEELVGEIWDEHDEVEERFLKSWTRIPTAWTAPSAGFSQEFFDVKLESDSVSVGGWVMGS